MVKLNSDQIEVLKKAAQLHGTLLRKKHIKQVLVESGQSGQLPLILSELEPIKTAYGAFNVASTLQALGVSITRPQSAPKPAQAPVIEQTVKNADSEDVCSSIYRAYVPEIDPLYVPFGQFQDLSKIVKSGIFYPFYVSGLSGNGKTFMIEQICAQTGRQLVRVNLTKNTDEEDLFGGFRLVNGETVWFDGPVIKAMKSGALLLLDEVDLSSANALCLQPVLEGKGVLLKKINQFVKPAPGFNVCATANTKGKGCDDGRLVGTNVLNEAFLERFAITIEQEYPSVSVEKKILTILFGKHGIEDEVYVNLLTSWSDIIRRTFFDGGLDEVISTRRLVHIANAYAIFKDQKKAVELCINRFDDNTQAALIKLYDSLTAPPPQCNPAPEAVAKSIQEQLLELEPII